MRRKRGNEGIRSSSFAEIGEESASERHSTPSTVICVSEAVLRTRNGEPDLAMACANLHADECSCTFVISQLGERRKGYSEAEYTNKVKVSIDLCVNDT